ncbi:MAG: hypothetical protein JJ863_21525 [Deltaproteobacteria bacterium]|nr:hypothetical protein [Deltaproteobacteria bacterium]
MVVLAVVMAVACGEAGTVADMMSDAAAALDGADARAQPSAMTAACEPFTRTQTTRNSETLEVLSESTVVAYVARFEVGTDPRQTRIAAVVCDHARVGPDPETCPEGTASTTVGCAGDWPPRLEGCREGSWTHEEGVVQVACGQRQTIVQGEETFDSGYWGAEATLIIGD